MKAHDDPFGHWASLEGPPRPGVVIIPDVWGVSDLYRRLAERLAQDGFATLVIDQYRYTGRAGLDAASVLPFIAQLSDPLVLRAVQEAIDALAASPEVADRKRGVVGFCMGGQYALLAACACTGLSACASFYGMVRYAAGLDPARKPRQPLDAIADLRCPVLGQYGAEDALIPIADVEELKRRLVQTPHAHDVRLYAGAGHAFLNDTRADAYRPAAASEAWSRLVPFLHEHLD